MSLGLVLLSSLWLSASCFQPGDLPEWRNRRATTVLKAEPDTTHTDDTSSQVPRRTFLWKNAVTASLSVVAANAVDLSVANAAAPVTAAEADSFIAKSQRLLRPKPPKALRPKLNRDFAVLLMRSSYNALDELDCVAMDQFQRDFFLIRQAEYEFYVSQLGPGIVQQGDLTDPYYFDFISFAQYATINREIFQDPAAVFNEQKPVEVPEGEPQQFKTVVVKRDLTNDMLAPTHKKIVASTILDRLEETFGETDAKIPRFEAKSRPSADFVLASVKQLTNLFLINGYAWEGKAYLSKQAGSASSDASGAELSISLTAPANIWSGQALDLRNKALSGGGIRNSFLLTTAKELVFRMGYEVASSSISYDGTKEISTLSLR